MACDLVFPVAGKRIYLFAQSRQDRYEENHLVETTCMTFSSTPRLSEKSRLFQIFNHCQVSDYYKSHELTDLMSNPELNQCARFSGV